MRSYNTHTEAPHDFAEEILRSVQIPDDFPGPEELLRDLKRAGEIAAEYGFVPEPEKVVRSDIESQMKCPHVCGMKRVDFYEHDTSTDYAKQLRQRWDGTTSKGRTARGKESALKYLLLRTLAHRETSYSMHILVLAGFDGE